MSGKERDFFLSKIATHYFTHLESEPDSLIARIYGLYSIKLSGVQTVHVLLMSNTINCECASTLDRIFDIKGSYVSRFVT